MVPSTLGRITHLTALALLAAAASIAAPAYAAEGSGCPNQSVRVEQGATYLPDCRGYEMVSPVQKNEEEVIPFDSATEALPFKASLTGSNIMYTAAGAFPQSGSGGYFTQYLATSPGAGTPRQTVSLNPESRFGVLPKGSGAARSTGIFKYFAPDLSCGVEDAYLPLPMHEGDEEPELAPGETAEEGIQNLYLYDSATADYTLVTNVKPLDTTAISGSAYAVDGASAGCRHVLFEVTGSYRFLGAPSGSLYEWDEGALRVASVLPDGKPADAFEPTHGSAFSQISADGSSVFFTAKADEGIDSGDYELFMRKDGMATSEISASQTSSPIKDIGAKFQAASSDGAQVFFTGSYGLTQTSSTGETSCSLATGDGCDLYDYDSEDGTLTDISADTRAAVSGDTTGADVLGVLGISEDGAYVYFSCSGQLVPGEGNTQAANVSNGEANVYVFHDGQLSYVADIGAREAGTGQESTEELDAIANSAGRESRPNQGYEYMVSRVSPDGRFLMFATRTNVVQSDGVTYDNRDAVTGEADPEEYEYSAASSSVTCVSCDPSGAPPTFHEGTLFAQAFSPYEQVEDGSIQRNLNDRGQVFLDSFDPLVAQATNGVVNAYEWEPEGVGSCPAGQPPGCVSLLDSGSDPNGSYFVEASADGENAYVTTSAQLAYPDEDGLRDIYDVREGGGTAVPPNSTPCAGEGCQGPLAPGLAISTPASAGSSTGNLPAAAAVAQAPAPGKKGVAGYTARSVKGTTVTVSVSAPSKGRIVLSGVGLRTVRRSVSHAGLYRLELSLTAKEKKALAHKKAVRLRIAINFLPSSGASTTSAVRVTFKAARKRAVPHA